MLRCEILRATDVCHNYCMLDFISVISLLGSLQFTPTFIHGYPDIETLSNSLQASCLLECTKVPPWLQFFFPQVDLNISTHSSGLLILWNWCGHVAKNASHVFPQTVFHRFESVWLQVDSTESLVAGLQSWEQLKKFPSFHPLSLSSIQARFTTMFLAFQ